MERLNLKHGDKVEFTYEPTKSKTIYWAISDSVVTEDGIEVFPLIEDSPRITRAYITERDYGDFGPYGEDFDIYTGSSTDNGVFKKIK